MKKRKLDKKGIVFLCLFIAFGLGIISYHYVRNYKIRTSVPSGLYSKEVKEDLNLIKGYPSILSKDNNYFISYTAGKNIIIDKIDELGKKIKNVSINGYSEYINDIEMVNDINSCYVVYTTYIDGSKKVVECNFDDNLNKKSENIIGNFNKVTKIDEVSLVYSSDNKAVYKNFLDNYSIDLNYKGIKMISGTKADDCYYLILMDSEGITREIKINNRKAEEKYSYKISKSSNINFQNLVSAADDKNIYSLIEVNLKGETKGVNLLTFPKDSGNVSYKAFSINNNEFFYSLLPVSSGREAKFIGITDVPLPGGKYSEELAEFTVKDGIGSNIINATRLDKIPYCPSYSVNGLAFLTNEGDDRASLYITSKNEKFKEYNNIVTSSEKELALADTASQILTSIAYMLVLGISWLLFGSVLVGIITFLDWRSNNAKIGIMLYISYIIISIFKTYIIYKTIYIRFVGSVRGFFSNPVCGCVASMLISFICFIFLIYKHEKDEDSMTFFLFFIPLLIDTLLTQLLFVPFL